MASSAAVDHSPYTLGWYSQPLSITWRANHKNKSTELVSRVNTSLYGRLMCLALWVLMELWVIWNGKEYSDTRGGQRNVRVEIGVQIVQRSPSFLAPGDTSKLGTRISVISMETAHRNNLAVHWHKEYPLYLLQSRYAGNYDMKFFCCYCL